MQAQTNVDSLVNVLETQELTPDEQLALYSLISKSYSYNDVEKSRLYATKGFELAEKRKNKNRMSYFYFFIGLSFANVNDYDSAFIFYEKALPLTQETGELVFEGGIYTAMGNIYYLTNKQAIALEYYLKALSIMEKENNALGTIEVLNNIGNIHKILKNFDNALHYYERTKLLSEEYNFPYGECGAYYSLGQIYLYQDNPDKAMEYTLKALEFSRSFNYKQFEITSLISLAEIYYIKRNDNNTAEIYARESLQISEHYGESYLILCCLNTLSNIYRLQERYEECDAIATRAWETDTTNIELSTGREITMNIVYANIFLGNKNRAADFLQKYDDIVDQITEKSLHESLVGMEVKYETEKKELRISMLEEKEILYIWLSAAGAVVLLLVIILLLIRHQLSIQKHKVTEQLRKLAEQKNELAKQQIKQLEQEKQLIATQSVLDGETAERSRLAKDLHNRLGGLLTVTKLNLKEIGGYSVMEQQDVSRFDKALGLLDQSVVELRRIAHHLMPISLLNEGLRVAIEDFCNAIPKAKFQYCGGDKLVRLDNRLEIALYQSAYELVNNAVKYAEATAINVQLMIDDNLVSLAIQDNGIGFYPDKTSSGTGLDNIRTHVSAYNGKMNVHSSPGNGTEVSIEIEF